jgi:hypothetical protein
MERVPASFTTASVRRREFGASIVRLEEAASRPALAVGWRESLAAALVETMGAFEAHVKEVEGPDGLLADLGRDAPRLSNRLAILEGDHPRIWAHLVALSSLVAHGSPSEVRARVSDVISEVIAHRREGADLVFEAYSADIGGQG